MFIYDTETCGFHGPTVLLQYLRHGEPLENIDLHSVFLEPIDSTLDIIDEMMDKGVIGFNLSFDQFHLCQTHTTLSVLRRSVGGKALPIDHINKYAASEPAARFEQCLKPRHILDLMLYARKGPYQSTMDRSDIRIKRVPTVIAEQLAAELAERIPLPDIYFARKADPTVRWKVHDVYNDLGDMITEFKDLVLKFAPSSGLKALAVDTGIANKDKRLLYGDVELHGKLKPKEYGYAPYALAVGTEDNWNGAWPAVINAHISHWTYNSIAREYATDDVKDTHNLYEYFGRPPVDDDDSVLSGMVGAVRWRGFRINEAAITKLRDAQVELLSRNDFNHNSVAVCKRYLKSAMDETEALILNDGTKAAILEEIVKWKVSDVHEQCGGEGCEDCNEGLIDTEDEHPAAKRASDILNARHASKEIDMFNKLLRAGRFHADFNVIGALSSRMSGAGGLNAQGIKRTTEVRSAFDLSDPGETLVGGDFAGFEVTLMDAAYKDPLLHEELLSGKKIHGLFGAIAFAPKTYDEVCATKGLPGIKDLYTRAKNGVFALAYEGNAFTLVTRVGLDPERAEEAYNGWGKKYKVMAEAKRETAESFQSMKQPNGIGTKVEWHEPADYVESMFGFRRYFTLENKICKVLFDIAENPPERWKQYKVKVVRRDRQQTQVGALRTALFAAAFAIQGSNMRAAGNHRIQSSGATLTKKLQRRIWDLQEPGCNPWRVRPINIHDEIMCPVATKELGDRVQTIVDDFVEEFRTDVPLLEIEWDSGLANWASK